MAVVRLTVVGNELDAEVVCGLLRSNGIHCFHRNTDMAAAITESGGFGMAGPTEVLVNEDDLDAARKLLPKE